MKVHAATRVIFVLGRRTRLTARAIEASSAGASSVTVLSVGYPVSRPQRRAVDAALGLAGRLGVTVDARLVISAADLPEHANGGGRLILTGSRRERRRFGRLLARA